jgi:hypothetical protein
MVTSQIEVRHDDVSEKEGPDNRSRYAVHQGMFGAEGQVLMAHHGEREIGDEEEPRGIPSGQHSRRKLRGMIFKANGVGWMG